MKNFSVMLLNATLVLATSNWARAEPVADNPSPTITPPTQIENAPTPATPNSEARIERRARQLPPRLQQMKEALNLTHEQQEAWQKFENTWTDQMRNILARSIGKNNKPMTAPERLQRQIEITEQRLEALKKISVVQEALYQILTPQQKQVMDNKSGPEAKPKIEIQPNPKIEIQPNPKPEMATNKESPSPVEIKIDPDAKMSEEKSTTPAPQANPEMQAPNSQESSAPESKPEVELKPAIEKIETNSPPPSEEKAPTETEKTQN